MEISLSKSNKSGCSGSSGFIDHIQDQNQKNGSFCRINKRPFDKGSIQKWNKSEIRVVCPETYFDPTNDKIYFKIGGLSLCKHLIMLLIGPH